MNTKKVCLITGANGLLGRGLTKSFHEHGYELILVDLDFSNQEPLSHSVFRICDVRDEDQLRDLFFDVRRLDVLINNAMITDPYNPHLEEMTLAQWNEVIDTNLTGQFLVTKHALPFLKERHGSIINISSLRAIMAEPFNEAFSASKGAILSFTNALSITYAKQVRVNCISPGLIYAPEDHKIFKNNKELNLIGRAGIPEDVSSLALFLASESAGFITGQNFVVDGGISRKLISK